MIDDIIENLFGASVRTHIVTNPENLATIAVKYYGNARHAMAIFQANRDRLTDPNRIYPGQTLIIPHIPHPRPNTSSVCYVD